MPASTIGRGTQFCKHEKGRTIQNVYFGARQPEKTLLCDVHGSTIDQHHGDLMPASTIGRGMHFKVRNRGRTIQKCLHRRQATGKNIYCVLSMAPPSTNIMATQCQPAPLGEVCNSVGKNWGEQSKMFTSAQCSRKEHFALYRCASTMYSEIKFIRAEAAIIQKV